MIDKIERILKNPRKLSREFEYSPSYFNRKSKRNVVKICRYRYFNSNFILRQATCRISTVGYFNTLTIFPTTETYIMPDLSLSQLLELLPRVKTDRNYWLIRTNRGEFYESFKSGNYVAIGYNEITLEDIQISQTGDAVGFRILSERISEVYEDEFRPGFVASQLMKFTYEIKKGDIVMIPSHSSHEISFGEVTQTATYLSTPINESDSPFQKRKKVRWLSTERRYDLDPNLFSLMYVHQTIVDAGDYSEYIDKEVSSFYIKGSKANVVLRVEATGEIKAKDLFEMGTLFLELVEEFCKEENIEYREEDVNVKLNVQSPGDVLLSGTNIAAIVIIGLIFITIAGGGFSFRLRNEVKAEIKTDGIIEKMRKFLNSKSNRKAKKELLEKHASNLQITNPEDLLNLLKELDK
jgi:hypothetical protein